MRDMAKYLAVFAVPIFLVLCFWAGVAYIALHFVAKLW